MSRINPKNPTLLDDTTSALLADFSGKYGEFSNQAGLLSHSPAAMQHLYGLLKEWRTSATLPRRQVEIVVVTVSTLNKCPYCVAHHTPLLRDLGLSQESIDQILDPNPVGFEALDLTTRDYARAVIERPWGIRDELFYHVKKVYSEEQIVELTVRISLCNLFNQFNLALDIPIESTLWKT